MAGAGRSVDVVIEAPDLTQGEVHERLLAAMSAGGEYHAVKVGTDRYQLARSYRPVWAIVAAIVTVWFAFLGLLFLLVKSTETCVVVVEADTRGCRLRVQGRMTDSSLGRMRTALEEASPSAHRHVGGSYAPQAVFVSDASHAGPPPANAGPPPMRTPGGPPPVVAPIPDILAGAEVIDGSAEGVGEFPEHTVAAGRRQQNLFGAHALLDDGTVVPLNETLLIGRNPSAVNHRGARIQAIDDPGFSVSKTHLAIEFDGSGWSVVDLHSTNGASVSNPGGAPLRLDPGKPVPVRDGSRVTFGDRSLTLVLAPCGPGGSGR